MERAVARPDGGDPGGGHGYEPDRLLDLHPGDVLILEEVIPDVTRIRVVTDRLAQSLINNQALVALAYDGLQDLPDLTLPNFVIALGSEATKDAFLRLAHWFQRGVAEGDFSLAPEGTVAVRTAGEARLLTRRDLLPLLIAIFVDACLLLTTLVPVKFGWMLRQEPN